MVFYICRAFFLFICVGLLAFHVCESRSTDLALRRIDKNQRILKAGRVTGLKMDKKTATVRKTNDSIRSSKRKVHRGANPIHNRT
ncbi:hypothetical protein CDL12_03196 [Handroanthus impetiginosus]|uniref:Uncharacterized protein n=1 Tax=Handroanthus impetiginosus TaxID=429701 RepID=A0A2G9I2U6_9LAMI|nr:hypothetical protein CDL12_03196 [Handroanthus impetiginosus]